MILRFILCRNELRVFCIMAIKTYIFSYFKRDRGTWECNLNYSKIRGEKSFLDCVLRVSLNNFLLLYQDKMSNTSFKAGYAYLPVVKQYFVSKAFAMKFGFLSFLSSMPEVSCCSWGQSWAGTEIYIKILIFFLEHQLLHLALYMLKSFICFFSFLLQLFMYRVQISRNWVGHCNQLLFGWMTQFSLSSPFCFLDVFWTACIYILQCMYIRQPCL